MPSPTIAPFGTWASPISAALVAKAGTSFDDVLVDPVTNAVYHVEKRPSEAGRSVVVETASGKDVFGSEWNARSGVHEYGGASATVYAGVVYFSNFADGRVYSVEKGGPPVPITPENTNHRFADFAVHPKAPYLLVAILEDHTHPAPSDVANSLVSIDTRSKSVHPLVSGADFYAAPAFSADGARLAWIQWLHPDMPWEGAEVHVADVQSHGGAAGADARLLVKNARKVKGARTAESAAQPCWAGADTLLFSCDASGYQSPWAVDLSAETPAPRAVLAAPLAQDFAMPGWRLGGSCGAVLDAKTALCTALRDGRSVLYLVDLARGTHTELASPYVLITQIRRTGSHSAVFLGDATDAPKALVALALDESGTKARFATLGGGDAGAGAAAAGEKTDKALFAAPRPLTFTARGGAPLHVVFYAPTNPGFAGPAGERPPCVVNVHGGPTAMAPQGLSLRQQYFTSRGFAWVDVNYSGSSGYGRRYIERLVGSWGVADVEDCVDTARALASPAFGEIDPARVLITGGSAGGYTVLQALCAASDAFAGGTASYGISNLFTLMQDTHKFESHYGFRLVGGTPQEVPDVYRARSPVFHAERITAPLLVLQGSADMVVPPSQAEEMVGVIRAHGGRVQYKVFEGEGHGWRKAETIVTALEAELAFYLDVLGLRAGAVKS
ncbi:alpha/beta-hydrolase [Phellopilus nigrolimitatus]|nr:alpha/beta-hydrolase [Phellopilus nigrolimitatus]